MRPDMWDGEDRRSNRDGERIAVLEARMDAVEKDSSAILKELKAIHDEMTRYKGFMGGVAFLISGVAIVASFAKDWLISHIK
jgi:hypothetical protein